MVGALQHVQYLLCHNYAGVGNDDIYISSKGRLKMLTSLVCVCPNKDFLSKPVR